MKNKTWIGIIFIGTALLIILECLPLPFSYGIPFTKIWLSLICLAWIGKAIYRGKISRIFFPLSFIFMLFEQEISNLIGWYDNIISNWAVLLIALLLTIGCELIFGDKNWRLHHNHIISASSAKNNLGNGAKYIDCATFKHEIIKNNMGQFDIYFQNVDAYDGNGTLEIICRMGEVNVHIPSSWKLINNISCAMGAVNVVGNSMDDDKTLTACGQCKMGNINFYIN